MHSCVELKPCTVLFVASHSDVDTVDVLYRVTRNHFRVNFRLSPTLTVFLKKPSHKCYSNKTRKFHQNLMRNNKVSYCYIYTCAHRHYVFLRQNITLVKVCGNCRTLYAPFCSYSFSASATLATTSCAWCLSRPTTPTSRPRASRVTSSIPS